MMSAKGRRIGIRNKNSVEEILWQHLSDLPYFRAMVRAVEDKFYQGLELPGPVTQHHPGRPGCRLTETSSRRQSEHNDDRNRRPASHKTLSGADEMLGRFPVCRGR